MIFDGNLHYPIEEQSNSFDPAILDQLRDLEETSPGLLGKLSALFLADAPELISSIEAAFRMGDAAMIARDAHALKGCSANMGAVKLASLCGILEDRAKADDLGSADASFALLREEFGQVRAVFEQGPT